MQNNEAQQLTPAKFNRNARIFIALVILFVGVPALFVVGNLWIW